MGRRWEVFAFGVWALILGHELGARHVWSAWYIAALIAIGWHGFVLLSKPESRRGSEGGDK